MKHKMSAAEDYCVVALKQVIYRGTLKTCRKERKKIDLHWPECYVFCDMGRHKVGEFVK